MILPCIFANAGLAESVPCHHLCHRGYAHARASEDATVLTAAICVGKEDETMTKSLAAGDFAPDFTLPADGGGNVSLKGLKGKQAVLYFYPKDDTSGCTLEAKAFNDHKAKFTAAGAEIVGISADSVASHDKFKKKYGLGFALASDESKAMLEAYGVWVEKSMYGKKYMGIERSTFLIGADGRVKQVWSKVKVPGHVEEVLAATQKA
jgi:thioredoxin-dependent peroxiredoxin